jgi:hypothetical protein
VSGSAEDLDCWLWRRPTSGELDRTGDLTVVEMFETTIDSGIQ